ncbi:cytochrome p450 [Trifolium pratense]|uniref:Cytochrome p450 n=1 Tax=Trifolium pratense TaxID=57577 RepID=A0A2K3M7Y9_TRIPR|nr:cytochrome p450 [Trifolium pratense]
MLVNRDGLWFQALAARYGVKRGRLREGGSRGSLWWGELLHTRDGGGESGEWWFGEHISKKVGDESGTYFWTGPWVDRTHLCERYKRLFDLAENKSTLVAVMFSLGWRQEGRRGCGSANRWPHLTLSGSFEGFHSRVVTLAGQATHQSKSGLSRHIITDDSLLCFWMWGGEVESAQHLFLSCSTFGSLWSLVTSWIDSSLVTAQTPSDHFV